jgi:putative secreted protein
MLRILIIFQKIYYNYLLNYDIIRHIDKLEMWKDVDKMKKLIFSLIFLVGVQGFSDTCSFAPNPDTFLERVIKKIQSEKRTNDIFCDRDKVKMAYYTIEDEDYNANVGVAIKVAPTTTNDDFKKEFYKKFNDYKDFFAKIDTKNLGKTPLPDKEIVRFYVQFPDEKSIIIIGKYEYNLKTKERQLVANLKAKDYFEKLNLFQPLAVKVTYSDDGHIF